jgi:ribosomal protein S16
MLKIRLSRAGKRNMPFFRVVLTQHEKAAKH